MIGFTQDQTHCIDEIDLMSAELSIHIEGQTSQNVTLGPLFSIGRGNSNDLPIQDSRASRQHAVIRLQSDQVYYLIDFGSANGTWLNERRVTIPSALKSGDKIQVANCVIEFTDLSAAGAAASQPSPDEMRTQLEFTTETISILVVDIRNYTGLSEAIPAEDLSRIVGGWFKDVGQIIEQHGGSIDKFIGDAVMAIWLKAKTEGNMNHVTGPLRSAKEMVRLARTYHEKLVAQFPDFGFAIGCGINTGKAIMGNVGVDSRRDVTVVGDCVNVAFRIESLCRELKHPIILSDEVKNAAGEEFDFEDLGSQRVKGKSHDLRVFALKA